ncbi:two-component system CitB family response regulator [Glaciihabitans tibetensis]|uniref:Transcriptional regulatory protein n=1 Tax=Glaciihabitans tibetensis TaxID=1266600 RepID=A0A2T0VDU6_9MICO|nr:response regulator [Glaciihabitans tibetensis]PRY68345.1 two-component system CitB family response regulator [Glaciihabitans tibetensis]
MTDAIRVLVVDDDFRVGGLHRDIVDARPGYTALEPVRGVRAARAAVRDLQPDLVICDVYLPDGDGIAFVAEIDVDAFMISAASDGATVRRALRAGALDYLIKPFESAQLIERLEAYRRFRNLAAEDRQLDQDSIDRAQRVLHGRDGGVPSVSRSTTEKLIIELLQDGESSSSVIAGRAGLSRATVQRHLAVLATRGDVEVTLRYGSTGRPEHQYSVRH